MQTQAQLVTDRDPAPRKCQDHGRRVIAVMGQLFDEPTTCLFTILEDHNSSFTIRVV
jgi:hypothetical protein